jgi:hypothetical protein
MRQFVLWFAVLIAGCEGRRDQSNIERLFIPEIHYSGIDCQETSPGHVRDGNTVWFKIYDCRFENERRAVLRIVVETPINEKRLHIQSAVRSKSSGISYLPVGSCSLWIESVHAYDWTDPVLVSGKDALYGIIADRLKDICVE